MMLEENELKYKKIYEEFYSNDVCSIEQMKELEELGIDTSDASCMWTSIQDKEYTPVSWLPVFRGEDRININELREKYPYTYKDGNLHYCYTLSDLIKKLPKYIIDEKSYPYKLVIDAVKNTIGYYYDKSGYYLEYMEGNNMLLNIFNMIKYLKIHKYDERADSDYRSN